jgi:N-acetylglutamate synthase-like GNAT family acetyltransferase
MIFDQRVQPGSVHYPSVNTFFVRPALISERKELEDLQLRASLNNPGDRDAMLAHPDAIELPLQQIAAGRVLVSEQNGVIVGFAALEPRADGESELEGLFVDPGMQRHGIGRALLAQCAEFARTQGSGALYVVGNPHAEAFYIACGFKAIGTVETRFGAGLQMRMII